MPEMVRVGMRVPLRQGAPNCRMGIENNAEHRFPCVCFMDFIEREAMDRDKVLSQQVEAHLPVSRHRYEP